MSGVQDRKPVVAILLAVHNNAGEIGKALASLQAQTFRNFECVIVDDGSSDDSAAVAGQLVAGDARFRIVRQANRGLGPALNHAAELTTAPLLARQDADDESLPERLACEVERMQRDPVVALCGTWGEFIETPWGYRRWFCPPDDDGELKRLLEGRSNPFIHGSVVMRRAAFEACGRYRYRGNSQDFDLWLRMMDQGRFANVPRTLYRYQLSAGSISFRSQTRRQHVVDLALRLHQERREHGAEVSDWRAEENRILKETAVAGQNGAEATFEYSVALRCLAYGQYAAARMHFSRAAGGEGAHALRSGRLSRWSAVYPLLRLWFRWRTHRGTARYLTAICPDEDQGSHARTAGS